MRIKDVAPLSHPKGVAQNTFWDRVSADAGRSSKAVSFRLKRVAATHKKMLLKGNDECLDDNRYSSAWREGWELLQAHSVNPSATFHWDGRPRTQKQT